MLGSSPLAPIADVAALLADDDPSHSSRSCCSSPCLPPFLLSLFLVFLLNLKTKIRKNCLSKHVHIPICLLSSFFF